jgi:hypothetical protein
VVFEEFRREYSKSEAPVSADAPDDHGWHFLEATKGVRYAHAPHHYHHRTRAL